jgi:hypothetical protein
VALLAKVIAADPGRPWPALLEVWLSEDPGLPLPPEAMGWSCAQLIERLKLKPPDPTVTANLSAFTGVIARAIERHPEHGKLQWAASGIARRCGHVPQALQWAARADELCQTQISASMLGFALRAADNERGAAQAFVTASERDLTNPFTRLDVADSLANLGDGVGATRWAEAAWELAPGLATAAARACYWRWRCSGDNRHLSALVTRIGERLEVQADGSWRALDDLGDALSYLDRAASRGAWPLLFGCPETAALLTAQRYAAGPRGAKWEEMAVFGFEPPSALLALERAVGRAPLKRCSSGSLDPLLPRRKVGVLTWALAGERLVPGMPPPDEAAERLVRPSLLPWYGLAQARPDAARLSEARVSDIALASLAVHPGPTPAGMSPWAWVRRWQLVCCVALGQRQATQLLLDIADGPEDWLNDSALAGLVEAAETNPAAASPVRDAVMGHVRLTAKRAKLVHLPHLVTECHIALTLPGLRARDTAWLREPRDVSRRELTR